MTTQLTLEDATVHDLRVIASSLLTEHGIQERFERFDRDHPQVYEELLRCCRRWKSAGGGRWSIDAAYHVVRFERVIAGLADPREAFKLNDHYTSRYARKILREHPEMEGLFELRGLRS